MDISQTIADINNSVTRKDVNYSTWVCFFAWALAVYDFILFANLLPVISEDLGWTGAQATGYNTIITLGTAIVAFAIGPIVDKIGRRKGIILCVTGGAIASLFTWLSGLAAASFGILGIASLIVVRSLAGMSYSEQAVNATYLNEMFQHSYTDERSKRRRGFIFSLVQSGWPVGAVLAAVSIYFLQPIGGWELCFIVGAFPALFMFIIGAKLKESPQFTAHRLSQKLLSQDKKEEAAHIQKAFSLDEHDAKGNHFTALFKGEALRATTTLSAAMLFSWLGVLAFAFQGTLILVYGKQVSFTDALAVLIVSNLAGFFGYLFHGWLGDRIGRKYAIASGWFLSAICFAGMCLGPNGNFGLLVGLYAVGTFFLIGPFAAMLFFSSESFPVSLRATGGAFINALGQLGAILGGMLFTMTLTAADASESAQASAWIEAGILWGAIPLFLAAISIVLAKNTITTTAEETAQNTHHNTSAKPVSH